MRFPRFTRRQKSSRKSRPNQRLFGPDPLEPRTMLAADVSTMTASDSIVSNTAAEVSISESSVNERFVDWISTGLVSRELSPVIQARLLRGIDQGGSRQRAAALVIDSLPGRQAELENTFRHLLDRAPTAWEQRRLLARGGLDQLALIRHVLQSREYFMTQGDGTNAGFVDALAMDMLGRVATEDESAAWVGALSHGMRRNRFVGGFLRSSVYIESAARQIARQAGPISENPELVARIIAQWGGPHPLTTAKATAFGSEAFLRRFENDAIQAPRTAPTEWSGAWLTPKFSLASNWNTDAQITLGDLTVIGASPDGAIWYGDVSNGAFSYDPSTRVSTSYGSDYVASIAPISDTEAWLIGSADSSSSPVYVARVGPGGSMTQAAPLPGGDVPSQIAASTDGLVWVIGQSGSVYAYDSTTNTWSSISSDGFTITQISIGSSSNIWGVGKSAGDDVVLHWTDGTGWSIDHTFNGVDSPMVAATADGYAWSVFTLPVFGQLIYLKAPGQSWVEIKGQTAPGNIIMMAANDRNRMMTITDKGGDFQFSIYSIGLVDRPAVAFPEPTSQWALGYDAINAYFGLTTTTMRAEYVDATAPFQTWLEDLGSDTKIAIPLGMDAGNWSTIKNQLISEINDVTSVNTFFTQLDAINTAANSVNSQSLSIAQDNVELTTQQQNDSVLELLIVGMFDAAVAGIVTAFSGGAGTVAAIIGSAITTGVADVTQDSSPNPDTVLEQTYIDLQESLLQVFVKSGAINASQWDTINADYGMLTTLAGVLNTGLWSIEDGTPQTYAAAMKPAYELYFYQTLMPAKYQVVALKGYLCDLYTCPTVQSPDYATYTHVVSDEDNDIQEDVYYINELGGGTNPFRKEGPYPTQSLMTTLAGIGGSVEAITLSQNGWSLKTLNAHT